MMHRQTNPCLWSTALSAIAVAMMSLEQVGKVLMCGSVAEVVEEGVAPDPVARSLQDLFRRAALEEQLVEEGCSTSSVCLGAVIRE